MAAIPNRSTPKASTLPSGDSRRHQLRRARPADCLALAGSLMQSLDVAWHSEHLGYVEVDGQHLGTMLVAPRTEEAQALVCTRGEEIQARWPKPFLLEHAVNLFPDPGGDYTAAGFLNEIVR